MTMDDARAIEILTAMLSRDDISPEEKEALREAIGMLAWSKLIPGRIESIKKHRKDRGDAAC